MEFVKTVISGVVLLKPLIHGDERGFFLESYKKSSFYANGIDVEFIQDNHSKSAYGVLRGLHYQLNPKAQGKLVRCVSGSIFDVAVDIRRGSPTFGQWVGYELSENNKYMLYIPAGFAHGFLTMSDGAEIIYKTTEEYSLDHDRGIAYNDPAIGINWPKIDGEIILSGKDKGQPQLQDADINFTFLI